VTARPLHILIVEDDADARDALQALLELEGYSVTAASDGPAGLQAAALKNPDLALVDIGLPGIDGYEIARRVRASEPAPRPFLVALTGWGQPEDRQRAIDAGFDAHLVKPVDPADLTRLIRNAARRS
jgi:CheY-like chemotaxis protein